MAAITLEDTSGKDEGPTDALVYLTTPTNFPLFFYPASSSPPKQPLKLTDTTDTTITSVGASFGALRFPENDQINVPPSIVQNQFGMTALPKLLEVDKSLSVYVPGLDLKEMNLEDQLPQGQVSHTLLLFN